MMHTEPRSVLVVGLDELVRHASEVAGRELAPYVLDPRRPVLFEVARLPSLPRLVEVSGNLTAAQHAAWSASRRPDEVPTLLVALAPETLLAALAHEGSVPCATYLLVDHPPSSDLDYRTAPNAPLNGSVK